ncbi:MAG: BatA and WFA domain-containing protein [Anaerolineales bacterium]|nr:BatA and WFA domain-containing protein [Anaerolineales bacterium]
MQLLTPFALALSALAIPIILLYMLKLRRKQTQVSSTMLWEKILRDKQANAPWQKLKRNLLLFLQLLILAALVVALARPALKTKVVASGSVIVMLDASASMNATDVAPSRFEEARKSVQALINGLSSDSAMTLILVARTPQTLIASETDKSQLKAALTKAQVTQGSADWSAAFALAAGATRNGAASTMVIVSDGGLPESGLPSLPAEVRYIPIGQNNDNFAISALALRASNGVPQLFAEVKNYSDTNRTVLLSLYLGDDLFDARQLEVPANSQKSISLENLPIATAIYKAHISDPVDENAALDSLSLDDTAFAVYQSSAARRALLVSQGNLFLEQLLASLPGIQPFRALPAADGTLQIPTEPFDLYIFDNYTPEEFPNANVLLINPSANPFFKVGESTKDLAEIQVNEHSLTRYVDWKTVHVLQARQTDMPNWMNILIAAGQTPLVAAGENNGQRIAALTFDLRESDLPLQVAYPILFSNLIDYLAPPSAFDSSLSLSAGETLALIPPTDADQIVIASPTNQTFTLAASGAQTLFSQTDELGYYAVNFISEDSTKAEYFAVNLFEPDESNIQPRETLQIGTSSVTPAQSQQIGLQELWKWLAGFALLILMIEWQVFHRKTFILHHS